MSLLDRYVFRNAAFVVGGLVLLALSVLMLERMLRIMEVISLSSNPASDAVRMVINLIPHYLGLAIPAAFLLGTIIATDRLNRGEELTAILASSVPLTRFAKPFILLSIMLSLLVVFVEGYMQPHSRYGYREAVHIAQQQTFTGAFREGKFVRLGDRTIWTRDELGDTGGVTGVFIHELQPDGTIRVATAPEGVLRVDPQTRVPSLILSGGASYVVRPDGTPEASVRFDTLAVAGAEELTAYRPRGVDEEEMTIGELLGALSEGGLTEDQARAAGTALNTRLSRAAILMTFPFIGIPLGMSFNRSQRSGGVFVGLLYLVLLQKTLEAASAAGMAGQVPAWLGCWGAVIASASLGAWLFYRSAYTAAPPPMESLPDLPKLPRFGRQNPVPAGA
ncbi:LptF/LptG family permease [Parvularcula dongshanensis]|uniref:Lipopolysaccharide export system permease protein n=1 Tax=Parvularcula dongshanensis TaxID=1173995 RepID=A0A840I367_9PROT|nr:LptF/LptG family permease [Parvularcula dongshanensis]MBB4659289.1 lipopolysaccharide export system permease protein [Parvularcula dongshanensis]